MRSIIFLIGLSFTLGTCKKSTIQKVNVVNNHVTIADSFYSLVENYDYHDTIAEDSIAYWLEQAIKIGNHTKAKGDLGRMYIEGWHYDVDTTKGLKLLKEAYQAGDLYAGVAMGYFYWDKQPKLSLSFFEETAQKGDTTAVLELTYIYMKGLPDWLRYKGDTSYFEKAIDWIKGKQQLEIAAMDYNLHEAQIDLAYAYLKGHYFPVIRQDSVMAKALFQKAWYNPKLMDEMGGHDSLEILLMKHIGAHWKAWLELKEYPPRYKLDVQV